MKNTVEFLDRLKGVIKLKEGEWKALCPAHNDSNQSLSIKELPDKLLVNCHAGCNIKAVLAALDLKLSDLFFSNGNKPVPRAKRVYGEIEITYPYHNADGKVLFEVVRYRNPKGFSQRRPNPDKPGEWIWGLKGVKPVIYHLPEVKAAIARGEIVGYAEGEKDADNITRAFGIVATTSPMGAGKFRDHYIDSFRGAKEVWICSDNDLPGRSHAAQVATKLHAVGIPVKVLDMPKPEIKDITDWISAGLTRDELLTAFDSLPPWEPPKSTATGSLPTIPVSNRQLRDITADALQALYDSNEPPHIFRRSGVLTRIGRDEKGLPFAEDITESALRGKLARVANFVRISDKGGEIAIAPPLDVTRDIDSLGEWDFPALAGIIEAPTLRPNGSVLTEPGYDKGTGLYFAPSPGLKLPAIGGDLEAAINLIKEVFCDFPFDSDASRANAYGALLSPILRPAIKGPTPMPVIDKPQAGTGASLMADTISIISTGHLAAMMGVPQSEEEWEKKLSSHLLAGRSLCVIDNIEGKLWSDTLSRYLTSSHVSIRPLGRSADIILANNMSFIATGNNIRLGGDMPRRCYWIRLDAGVARPWMREVQYKHVNQREWIFSERGNILAAILTVASKWMEAGKPVTENLPMLGGFEDYCRTIGGILNYMGIKGFMGNLLSMYDTMDQDTPQWEAFLAAWMELIGEEPITAAQLIKYINESEELAATLPDALVAREGKDYSRRVGNALAKKDKVRLPNGLMVLNAGKFRRAITWQVVSYENANSHKNSLKCELGELNNTPAYTRRNDVIDIFSYKYGVETNSHNSQLASKPCELTHTEGCGQDTPQGENGLEI